MSKDRRSGHSRLNAANITINLTHLITILGVAWAAFGAYNSVLNRLETTEARQIQLQSQVGEVSARLKELQD